MKKFLLSACIAALAMSASAFNLAQPNEANPTPVKMENVKEATPEIFNNFVKSIRANKAPRKAVSQQSDLYKGYMQQGGNYTFNVSLENHTLTIIDNATTAISDLSAATVAGVKYVNLAGQVSSKPFDGVNIVVTTLTDGTTQTSKVIK
ncbi:MAG: hypothetical protein IJ613_05975 [Muribaculaceae bacterium]|nr:hypothetical protein [Muribaculaceae bacterium]